MRIGNLLWVLLFPLVSFSQINESDTMGVQANVAATGFWQDGNVQTLIFRTKSDLSYRPNNYLVFKTINSYVYQAFSRSKADEDILSLNFLYFSPEKKLYPQIIGIFSTNFRRSITSRYLGGAGVTYQAVQGKDNWLKLSLSTEYEKTRFRESIFNIEAYNGQSSISTVRATFWVNGKYTLMDNKFITTLESFYQPSLEKSNNFRWQVDVGFQFPITKKLSFKVNYLHTRENIVIQNQKQDDRFLTFGVAFKT